MCPEINSEDDEDEAKEGRNDVGGDFHSLVCGDKKLERLVATVAKGTLLRVLTTTEVNRAVLLGLIRHRRKCRTFVSPVTERLTLALTTGTPIVSFAGLHENRDGRFLWDVWGAHRECC